MQNVATQVKKTYYWDIDIIKLILNVSTWYNAGADQGGESHPARAPPKIGKNMIFWCIIVIFHTKYPKMFRASLRNWKKYDFLA
jgi:hypothetical protein